MRNYNTTLKLIFFFSFFSFLAVAQTRTIRCNTIDEIRAAMADAKPGDEIIVESGSYLPSNKIKDNAGFFPRFTAGANGTASNPIILKGEGNAVLGLSGTKYNGDVLSITGNYWIIRDLTFTGGTRGILTDKANFNQIINVTVHDIGSEGIHLRNSSSNNLIRNCNVYDCGVKAPGFGEGIYVGSDRKAHERYAPDCDNNTIEGCTIGPDVRAEGMDIKEGCLNTIVRNCIFSGKGISGENGADAFIDLKGKRGFIYNNTFNRDGSSIIASGIDFQQRTDVNSGYQNAIFGNTFNFGNATSIPSARRKGGDPFEIHYWNNKRDSNSPDFPTSDSSHNRTIRAIITTCPSWNIVPCSGGNVNRPPVVTITSPSADADFTEGANITIAASASDNDGSVSKVAFFNGSVKISEDTTSPYTARINNASIGTYTLTAIATDNDGATTRSSQISVMVTGDSVENVPPSVSFKIPSSNQLSVNKGYSLTVEANASDADGSIANVQLLINGNLVRQENFAPYEWGHSGAPDVNELNGLTQGVYQITLIATDNDGQSTTSSTLTLTVLKDQVIDPNPNPSDCNFGTPLNNALPAFDRVSYTNVYVLGKGGPDLDQVRKFTFNWNPVYNGLYQFALNTKNGVPDYYISLKDKITHNLASAQPSVTIQGSGIEGFDGAYWVARDNDNFAMVSQNGGYSIYFSNSSTPPGCNNKSSLASNTTTLSVYPNPASDYIQIQGLSNNNGKNLVLISDIQGKLVKRVTAAAELRIAVSDLNSGLYFVTVSGQDNNNTFKFIKQ